MRLVVGGGRHPQVCARPGVYGLDSEGQGLGLSLGKGGGAESWGVGVRGWVLGFVVWDLGSRI